MGSSLLPRVQRIVIYRWLLCSLVVLTSQLLRGDREKKGSPALYWMPGFFDIKAGESLLILRNAHDDGKLLKTAKNIIDITGGLSLTSGQSLVWPIVRTTAPNAKVIDGAKGFSDGKVYHRAKVGTASFDEAAWNKSAFTGLGYKRKVTNEEQYAGSPWLC